MRAWPALLLVTALLCGAAQSATVPLPSLPAEGVELRVVHAVNPRLPRMDAAQLQIALEAMRAAVKEHFGISVRFAPLREVPIADLFATIPPTRRAEAARESYDFKSGKGNRQALERAFAKGLREGGESLDKLATFLAPHTPLPPATSFEVLGARTVHVQLERVERWRTRKALDGGPAIDNQPFNEFPMWLALGHGDVPYELVLTNQLIAGVENVWPAVHTAVRGGYSNGITTWNRLSRWGTLSIWSTYAFTGNDAQLVEWRGGESYTPEEAAQLAGLSGAHEIGHQLLHLLHPFGRPECLMDPVPMFSYRAWSVKLDASRCALGSSREMTPGVYKFNY